MHMPCAYTMHMPCTYTMHTQHAHLRVVDREVLDAFEQRLEAARELRLLQVELLLLGSGSGSGLGLGLGSGPG